MNTIRINMTIDSLAKLTLVSPDHYNVVVKFFNSSGAPLDNANIPNTYTALVNTTSTTFNVDVPVVNGSYSIPDVTIKVFTSESLTCCIATSVKTITNTVDGDCTLSVIPQFIRCEGTFAAEIFGTPTSISIKAAGDNTERFTSRAGAFLFFTVKPGTHIYKLQVSNADCTVSHEMALTCGDSAPTFNSQITQPFCIGTTLNVGNVRIFDVFNATRYKVCYSATFTCDNCASSDGVINQSGDTTINIFPPNPGQSYPVTIRVFNGNSCDNYKDIFFTMTSPVCGSTCNLTFTLTNPTC